MLSNDQPAEDKKSVSEGNAFDDFGDVQSEKMGDSMFSNNENIPTEHKSNEK